MERFGIEASNEFERRLNRAEGLASQERSQRKKRWRERQKERQREGARQPAKALRRRTLEAETPIGKTAQRPVQAAQGGDCSQ